MASESMNALRGTSRLGLRSTRVPGDVVMITLLERSVVAALTVSDTAWDQLVLTDESFEGLGPGVQDLVVHADLRNTTGTFECRVVLQRKHMDSDWTPAPASIGAGDVVLAVVGADGYAPIAVFNDRTRLNAAKIRLVLQYHAKATGGGAVGNKAELSLSVALRFYNS